MGLAVSKHEEYWEACGFGHSNKVREYLQSKVIDVNWRNHSQGNSTTLHLACQGKIDILRILLEAGSDVNAKDDSGNLALHLAAMNGHPDIVEELIACGSNIDTQNSKGWTAIINAAYWCRLDCLKLLLKHNADIHINNKDGRTALFEACRSPCKESGENDFSATFGDDEDEDDISNMIQLDAKQSCPDSDTCSKNKVNGKDSQLLDKTSVKKKSKDGDKKKSKSVTIDEVADVKAINENSNAQDAKTKSSNASETNSISNSTIDKDYERELADIVRALIDNGADVNGLGGYNQDDFTPIVFAAYHGHNEIVKVLLEYSCNKTPQALHWAMNKSNTEVVKTLIHHGFIIEVKPDLQHVMPPPLSESQMPQRLSSSEFVRCLLANGSSVNSNCSSTRDASQRRQCSMPVVNSNAAAAVAVFPAPLPPTSQPPPLHDRPPAKHLASYEDIPSIDD